MYKRLKSKLLAAALTLALIPSAFTCTALAAEVTDPPLVKATGYQDFPAYYEDSHHLPNQVTHPDVVVRDAAWNGYRYWAIYTPNVTRTSIYENPSIVASNDGVHWEAPVGLTNPIDPQPSSTRYPAIELKGLNPAKMYRIVDYVNNRVVATNLTGDNFTFEARFTDSLLVKAVEITTPDPEVVDPDYGFTSVDDRSADVTYTGTWHDDASSSFSEGTARYTNEVDATVEFSFAGTAIRWYGQEDTNFGTADVYIDDTYVETVNAYGTAKTGVRLFEALDLTPAVHTIKIVCKSGVIDIDRFAYEAATIEPEYEKVDATSERITYVGAWEEYQDENFNLGKAMKTSAEGAYAEFTFTGTAVRVYAEMSFNFGTADVYLDGELVENVILYGQAATGQLMFERTGLTDGEHTIRFAQNAWNINLDYFSYLPSEQEENVIVDAMDNRITYTGSWNDDQNDAFQNGTARYASGAGATAEFAFNGTAIRWYGQHDTNFGTARVYIDDVLIQEVNVNGAFEAQQLLFERTGLSAGSHVLRIVCESPVIDIDYLVYSNET